MKRSSNACPDCGRVLGPAHMPRHRGSRPCRQRQVEVAMAGRGLYPLKDLGWTPLVKKSGVRYERIPGYGKGGAYRSENLWRCDDPPLGRSFDDEFYAGLGDRLFVEAWAAELLLTPGLVRTVPHSKLVEVFRRVKGRGEEFQRMLCTVLAVGGPDAFNAVLVTEGVWSWEKRRKK